MRVKSDGVKIIELRVAAAGQAKTFCKDKKLRKYL